MSLPDAPARRRLLAGLGAGLGCVAGAGCLGLSRMDDLTVYNNTGRSVTVEIVVTSGTDVDGATAQSVFTAEWSLAADTERRVRDGLPASGQFAVAVSGPDLPSTSHQWRRAGPTEGLVIWLSNEEIDFGTLTN